MSLQNLLVVIAALCMWTPPALTAPSKLPIRISNDVVYSLSGLKNSDLMNLDRITFTLENLTEQPLTWIKIRMVYRSNRGDLLQTDTIERDFSKQPLAPGDAKQITNRANIEGFNVGKQNGLVSIEVTEVRFAGPTPANVEAPARNGIHAQESRRPVPSRDATFTEYQRKVVNAIRRNWVWSGENRNQRALVQFSITDKGEVTGIRITEPSGDKLYDESVLLALSKSSPLPAPPAIHRKDFSLVELNFESWMLSDTGR